LKGKHDEQENEEVFQFGEFVCKNTVDNVILALYNTFKTCSFAFSSSSFINTTHC
jgi:hypothetical protein